MANLPPSQRAAGAAPVPPQESLPPVEATTPEAVVQAFMPTTPPPIMTSAEIANPTSPAIDANLPAAKRAHDAAANDILLKLYLEKRVKGQLEFYKRRAREFDNNSFFTVRIGAFIMAVSAFLAALGAGRNSPALAMATALLPALAALVASFRQLYQWEKQAALYRDASLGLQEAELIMPDNDLYDKRAAPLVYNSLVKSAEDVFMAEINQWGQIALGLANKEDQDNLNQALLKLQAYDEKYGQGGSQATAGTANNPPPPPVDFQDGGVG